MSSKKYDIPYSMKPTKKGKKSRYASYIEENNTFAGRFLSSSGKKLCLYVTFFVVFAFCFITALRANRHPEALDYELDLEFSNNREKNLIDEAILDTKPVSGNAPAAVDIEVDEIDILDSDDGELPSAAAKDMKTKKVAKDDDTAFNDELSGQIFSGNQKLNANKAKWDKINALENKKLNDARVKKQVIKAAKAKLGDEDDLVAQVAKKEQAREKGRGRNAVKGEELL